MKKKVELYDARAPDTKPGLWKFRQDNSGGDFIINNDVSIEVYIEADNEDQANNFAETRTPIYFDSEGRDCPCCGSRWSSLWDEYPAYSSLEELEEEFAKPSSWREGATRFDYISSWCEPGQPVVIVYLKSGVKVIYSKDE